MYSEEIVDIEKKEKFIVKAGYPFPWRADYKYHKWLVTTNYENIINLFGTLGKADYQRCSGKWNTNTREREIEKVTQMLSTVCSLNLPIRDDKWSRYILNSTWAISSTLLFH